MAVATYPDLILRSDVPGRQRWQSRILRDQPELGRLVEKLISKHKGIVAALANPLTGRLLLRYDHHQLSSSEISKTLQAAWRSALKKLGLETPPSTAERKSPSKTPPAGATGFKAPNPGSPTAAVPSAEDERSPVSIGLGSGLAVAGGVTVVAAAGAAVTGVVATPVLLTAGAVATAVTTAVWAWRRMTRRASSTGGFWLFEAEHPLSRLWVYAEPYRRQIYLASMASIANKVLELAPPFLIGLAVDVVVAGSSSLMATLIGVSSLPLQLLILGALTVFIWSLESWTQYIHGILWRELAQTMQHDLRLAGYAHVQEAEAGYLENESSGHISSILNEDINTLQVFLDDGVSEILQIGVNLVVCGAVFVILTPAIALVSIFPVPILLWAMFRYRAFIAPRYDRVRDRASQINTQLVNNVRGIFTIRSYTTEAGEKDRIAGLSESYREAHRELIPILAGFMPLIRLVVMVSFTGTMILGGLLVAGGTLNPGAYTFVIYLSQRFLWPLTRLGGTLDLYEQAMASARRVLDLLEAPIGPAGGEVEVAVGKVRGDVIFDAVTFAYQDRSPVLRDLSLVLEPHRITGVVGLSGAGKTTLVKLLLRFYDPQAGKIAIDGHDLRELRLENLRRVVGLVSQEPFLLTGTIYENIAYGSDGASLDEVVEAAKLTEIHDTIVAMPHGYDSMIGESGVKLSGGQRQRLCLARVLVKNPPVLILDEATSSVDNETEAAIIQSLKKISEGRTTLIIAHRLSMARSADHIYVLAEDGRIAESGSHRDLLERDGVYASLWRAQIGATHPLHIVEPSASNPLPSDAAG